MQSTIIIKAPLLVLIQSICIMLYPQIKSRFKVNFRVALLMELNGMSGQ